MPTARDVAFNVLGVVGGAAATCLATFMSTVAHLVPPVRAKMLENIATDMQKDGLLSIVDEVDLMRNMLSDWRHLRSAFGVNFAMARNAIASNRHRAGDAAPNPTVLAASGEPTPLHAFLPEGDRLLVVNFGSLTWGCYAANMERMNRCASVPGVTVLHVYLAEAHPSDGWFARDTPAIKTATCLEDRRAAIDKFVARAKPVGDVVADAMDNGAARAFSAFPDRIVVLRADGTFAYTQRSGPMFYNALEALAFLEANAPKAD